MSQNVTKYDTFSNLWYKATFTFYVEIRLGTTLNRAQSVSRKLSAQGWNNRTLISHERVDSRFFVLPGSESIFAKITEYIYFSLILTAVEFRYKSDQGIVPLNLIIGLVPLLRNTFYYIPAVRG